VRQGEAPEKPDPMRPDAVPIAREYPAEEMAKLVRPDNSLPFLFDKLPVLLPLPPLGAAILRLIDGRRTVAEIASRLAERGTDAATFARTWRATYATMEAVNRILLASPP
jgi:hypothetical protein